MAQMREINLEAGKPFAEDALRYLKSAIATAKKEKIAYLVIIHGYGSTGKGGVICTRARSYLKSQKEQGQIKNYVIGEEFDMFHFDSIAMKNNCPDLNRYYEQCNHGITVVEL